MKPTHSSHSVVAGDFAPDDAPASACLPPVNAVDHAHIDRRRENGWGLYGLLGITKGDKDKMHAQHQRNYRFFDAPVGLIVALIGPNGAGKSACIAGQYPLTSGHIAWNGQVLEKLAPAERLRHGVARTFQVAQVFEALTVLQNVQLTMQAGIAQKAISAFKRLDGQSREAAEALLEETGCAAGPQARRHDAAGGRAKSPAGVARGPVAVAGCG